MMSIMTSVSQDCVPYMRKNTGRLNMRTHRDLCSKGQREHESFKAKAMQSKSRKGQRSKPNEHLENQE